MKLPTNSRERAQALTLLGLGALAVLYAVVQLGIMPVLRSNREARVLLQNLREKTRKARIELATQHETRMQHDQITAEIEALSEQFVLKPVLGSYDLGAREMIENAVKDTGFQVASLVETSFQEMPPKKTQTPYAFRGYGMQVRGTASYHDLILVLRRIETRNPFLTITELTISPQAEDPERHRVAFQVVWPVRAEAAAVRLPPAAAPVTSRAANDGFAL